MFYMTYKRFGMPFLHIQDMAHFDFGYGQKCKIFTYFVKPKSFLLYKQLFFVLLKSQNFSFLTMPKIKIGKMKKCVPNFLKVK